MLLFCESHSVWMLFWNISISCGYGKLFYIIKNGSIMFHFINLQKTHHLDLPNLFWMVSGASIFKHVRLAILSWLVSSWRSWKNKPRRCERHCMMRWNRSLRVRDPWGRNCWKELIRLGLFEVLPLRRISSVSVCQPLKSFRNICFTTKIMAKIWDFKPFKPMFISTSHWNQLHFCQIIEHQTFCFKSPQRSVTWFFRT